MEKLSKKVVSLPVFSVSEGEQIGYVKNLVVDPQKKEIIALVIDQKGWFRENKIIPFNRVNSIGENAITVDKSGTAEKPANLPQILKLLKDPVPLINSKVVTAAGRTLGYVEEFWFNIQGEITRLEISGGLLEGFLKGKAALPAEEIVTIGKNVIIATDGAENQMACGEKQLTNTVKELKQVTAKAWENTVTGSQKIGKAIKNSISKLVEEEEKLSKSNEDKQNPADPIESPNIEEEDTKIKRESNAEPQETNNETKEEETAIALQEVSEDLTRDEENNHEPKKEETDKSSQENTGDLSRDEDKK
ncbi:MAG: PRC-barrel domain-containing protein [Desulfitobacteriaceae bacterium]|nr:PRC-barrel domain-containing protein [Desulfitobacteriaceae bacterium]MDD4752290.1 PRC-barrel domain-containing protein [Desulfitobacteriaceae bacterium]